MRLVWTQKKKIELRALVYGVVGMHLIGSFLHWIYNGYIAIL